MKTYEYGAMSSKYSLQAENKLIAYIAMVYHYDSSSHMIALYEPIEEVKNDCWISFDGKISDRLDEIFLAESGMNFDQYLESHIDEVKNCLKTIKQLI